MPGDDVGAGASGTLTTITFRIDPFPSDAQMDVLMGAVWGPKAARRSWTSVLKRSLGHVAAFDGDCLVGFVNVAWDGGIHAFLLDTSVHPDLTRCGMGTQLVSHATNLARQRGAAWLHVDFEPHLDAFYTACGFRATAAGLIALSPAGEPTVGQDPPYFTVPPR